MLRKSDSTAVEPQAPATRRAALRDLRTILRPILHQAFACRVARAEIERAIQYEIATASRNGAKSVSNDDLFKTISDVLSRWHRDLDFLDEYARPRALPSRGSGSLSELIQRVAPNSSPPEIVRAMSRAGLLRRLKTRRLLPRSRVALLKSAGPDLQVYVGSSLMHFARTLDSNTSSRRRGPKLLERAAQVSGLSARSAKGFRKYVAEQGAQFISNANDWLEAIRRTQRNSTAKSRISAGVHAFAFVTGPEPKARKSVGRSRARAALGTKAPPLEANPPAPPPHESPARPRVSASSSRGTRA